MALDLEHIRSRPVFVIGALSFCLFTVSKIATYNLTILSQADTASQHTLLYGFVRLSNLKSLALTDLNGTAVASTPKHTGSTIFGVGA